MSTKILSEFSRCDSFGTQRKYVSYHCTRCGVEHSKPKRNFWLDRPNFCSVNCAREHQKILHSFEAECAWCANKFHKKISTKGNSRSGLYFCSRLCKDKAQSLEGGIKEIQPNHYGEIKKNYRETAFKNLPARCNRCDFAAYPEILEVHHKDHNHHNNTVDNLEILCPNCHEIHHFETKSGKYAKSGGLEGD